LYVNNSTIDEAILSMLAEIPGHWRKVAAVIGRVSNALGDAIPEGDPGYQLVAERIEVLLGEGRLVAQGDVKNWRFSEVRVPD
jgi:hypothetical protein